MIGGTNFTVSGTDALGGAAECQSPQGGTEEDRPCLLVSVCDQSAREQAAAEGRPDGPPIGQIAAPRSRRARIRTVRADRPPARWDTSPAPRHHGFAVLADTGRGGGLAHVVSRHDGFTNTRRWARVRRPVFDRDGWRCPRAAVRAAWECDHVTPLWRDRSKDPYEPDGCKTMCGDCHLRKLTAARPPRVVPGGVLWHGGG